MMKLVRTVLPVLLILAITQTTYGEEKIVPIDTIVAVVNEGVILQSELDAEINRIKQHFAGNTELPPEDQLRTQVLERLIIQRLQLDEADRYGITIDDVTLSEGLKNLAKSNGLTLEGLRQQVIRGGEDYETFRQDLKKDMTLKRLRQGLISSRIKVSEAEVDEYLASRDENDDTSEYLVSDIQIAVDEGADNKTIQAAREKAEKLYTRLRNGEDFSKIAIAESNARNALEGGTLGWHKLSELPKQFAATLRSMTPGNVSKPFRLSNDFYILKLHQTKGIQRQIVKQVNARHILIPTDKLTNDKQARKQLNDLRKQIMEGAKFSELAKQYSKDPVSAANGGALGWAEPELFTPEFAKVLKTLPVNKVSQPIKTRYGWHIVQVLGWRDYDKTVDIIRNTAFEDLFQRKAMIEEDLWIRRLRAEAFVDIRFDE